MHMIIYILSESSKFDLKTFFKFCTWCSILGSPWGCGYRI